MARFAMSRSEVSIVEFWKGIIGEVIGVTLDIKASFTTRVMSRLEKVSSEEDEFEFSSGISDFLLGNCEVSGEFSGLF